MFFGILFYLSLYDDIDEPTVNTIIDSFIKYDTYGEKLWKKK